MNGVVSNFGFPIRKRVSHDCKKWDGLDDATGGGRDLQGERFIALEMAQVTANGWPRVLSAHIKESGLFPGRRGKVF